MNIEDIKQVERAALKPGDVLVVSFDGDLSSSSAAHIKAELQKTWPNNEILVIAGGLELSVLTQADLAAVEANRQPLNWPVWKCTTCGCLWRDNLDDTVSLLDARQKSCNSCEAGPTKDACEIHWLNEQDEIPEQPRQDSFSV